MPSAVGPHSGVHCIEWMAPDAMRLGTLPQPSRWLRATTQVLFQRHWLQVTRTHTCSIPAQMVEGQPVPNGTNKPLIHHPMSTPDFTVNKDCSVTLLLCGSPFPATVPNSEL